MRREAIIGVAALLVGALFLLNPLYLPLGVADADGETRYVHTVEKASGPTDGATPYEELSDAEKAAFDEARENDRVTFSDPDRKLDGYNYGGGDMLYVEYEGTVYQFSTSTATAGGDLVLFQDLFLSPTLFIFGLVSAFGGGYLLYRGDRDPVPPADSDAEQDAERDAEPDETG